MLRKGKKYTEELGTLAPAENIDLAYEELGGEEGAARREKSKVEGLEKRELTMTGNLKEAILRLCPSIPEKDMKGILEMARRRGAVGTAQWIYFPPEGGSKDAFELAAELAVRAHVRHSYTGYDEMLSGSMDDQDARREARGRVAGDIEEVLRSWK
ncbi:MAG: DUF2293 domain-containing protein [Actinobacteria bacterium]|nr:DUF2293 domain-containing protein [Actinomycetota bacterium]